MTRKPTYVVVLSIAFGLFIWIIDAVLDYFIYYEGTFWNLLIFSIPKHEVYIRLFVLGIFTIFGIIISRIMEKRRRAEESLQESKERYLILLETIPHGIQEIDTSGVITFANDAYCRLMGYEREEILGKAIWELVEFETASGKEELQEYLKLLVKDQPSPTPYFQKNRKKNGELIDVQVDWNYKRNEQGLVTGFISVLTDITERKRAEEALKRAYAELERRVEERTADLVKANEKLQLEIKERKRAEVTLREGERRLSNAQSMANIGDWDWDLTTNTLTWSDEMYLILGLDKETYIPTAKSFGKFVHPDDQYVMSKEHFDQTVSKENYDLEYRIIDQSTKEVKYIYLRGEVTFDDDGKPIRIKGTLQNITDRKLAEEQIKASLREKEVLLSEIHHRVKNNMQVVSSLLRIQSDKIKDKQYADMFKESQDRIKSMALVHEKLYQSEDFANVDFKGYISTLVNGLFKSYGIDTNKIALKIEVEGVSLGTKTAIPCALLINELVSNSLKYAFPEERKGEIRIALRSINDDELELIVSDNGIGIPEDLDIRNTKSLGLELVMILAEDQLEGKVELNRTGGTKYNIQIKRQM